MSDTVLQEGQVLLEAWHVEFTGKKRMRRPAEEWIECRVVKMYHGTIYGGANGTGKTVEEARLNAVLGLANAICDDLSAFDHDADEIYKAEMYRWWLGKIRDWQETIEFEEDTKRKSYKKAKRNIKRLTQMMAEWQEDYDYYPEAESEAEAKVRTTADIARLQRIRQDTDRRRAASSRLRRKAARVTESVEALAGADDRQPDGSPD